MVLGKIIWGLRHWIWSNWLTLRHRLNRPQKIGPPPRNGREIKLTTYRDKHKALLPMDVPTYDRLPSDENKITVRFVRATTLTLNRIFPARQNNLPEINEDITLALDRTLTGNYRKAFRSPKLPRALAGGDTPNIDELAVAGPYSLLLTCNSDDEICWDFEFFNNYEHHSDVLPIGLTAIFDETEDGKSLRAREIRSKAFGVVRPGDSLWSQSKRLAICAATTYTTLTRHFNYVHLICGVMWGVGTRNELSTDHPIYRLLWPSILNSFYTVFATDAIQLYPDGDFVNTFSFTHNGLMNLYTDMTKRYRANLMDPRADHNDRGLGAKRFFSPTQQNIEELFDVMHRHARRYVYAYYRSDSELIDDKNIRKWIETMNSLIPNGLDHYLEKGLSRDSLAHLIGAVIYEGCTTHDMVGTTLWDYQLWVDRNPVRLNRDGKRISLSIFHRTIINNFALQLGRSPLLDNYSKVALDDKGRKLFTQWYEDCKQLQAKYDSVPADLWRMEPKNLEVSMNAWMYSCTCIVNVILV